MYERFYGFNVKPFALLPQEEFMFLSRQHSTALALLTYSLHNRAMFCVVCGDIGTGKTTLLRYLLRQHEPHIEVGMITSTTGRFEELLPWMLTEFGLDYRGLDKIGMQQALVAHFKRLETLGKRAVLVIDEAQVLAPEVLEELRLFSNMNAGRTHAAADDPRRPARHCATRCAGPTCASSRSAWRSTTCSRRSTRTRPRPTSGTGWARRTRAARASSPSTPATRSTGKRWHPSGHQPALRHRARYGYADQALEIDATTVFEVLADRVREAS